MEERHSRFGEWGRLLGMFRRRAKLPSRCLGDLTDVFSETMAGTFKEKPERQDKWLSLLESRVAGSGFFVGDDLTVADFYAYFVFLWLGAKEVTYLTFPGLTK